MSPVAPAAAVGVSTGRKQGGGRDIGGQATAWAMAQRSGFTLRVHMDSDLQGREEAVARPGRARVRESQQRKHVSDGNSHSDVDCLSSQYRPWPGPVQHEQVSDADVGGG